MFPNFISYKTTSGQITASVSDILSQFLFVASFVKSIYQKIIMKKIGQNLKKKLHAWLF